MPTCIIIYLTLNTCSELKIKEFSLKKSDLRFWFMITILTLGALFLAACSGSASEPKTSIDSDTTQSEETNVDDEEHENEPAEGGEHEEGDEHEAEHIHAALPTEFEGLENPFGDDAAAIAAGAETFTATCAKCHGETGDGDGPIAAGLDIKPASLSDGEMMADLSDAYVFWRITMGGAKEPFNSTMPSFLFFSEEQRWQLVSFVRSLSQ
jgi:mono/diheme cytochrome c family protein